MCIAIAQCSVSLMHGTDKSNNMGRSIEIANPVCTPLPGFCVDLADHTGLSKSRNLSVPPCYLHRDRATQYFVDARSSLTHPFPFPRGRGRGWSSDRPPVVSISRTIWDYRNHETCLCPWLCATRSRNARFVDARSSLTHPSLSKGKGRGMEFGLTTVCVDLADHTDYESRNLSVPPLLCASRSRNARFRWWHDPL